MNKLLIFIVGIVCSAAPLSKLAAQKYMTKTGQVYFMSHTDAIDIDARNNQVAAIADTETGELVVIVLIKAFEFTLATADKHFNETYMESDEYPKAIFKGTIDNLKGIDASTDAEYEAIATGKLTLHGETRDIQQSGKIVVKNGELSLSSSFLITIADYQIEVPKTVEDRVADEVEVQLELSLNPR